MGGGGSFYDRDVTRATLRGSSGYTSVAEEALSQPKMDPELLPKELRLSTKVKNPLVYDFDVTGSMGDLPRIIWDKWPGIVGQIQARKYLPNPAMSITATGDIRTDGSPLQMCKFAALRNLDKWFKRIHLEGYGGGQASESYEMTAYYYANYCSMPNAELPIYLITGDEACVENLYADDLREHFGGEHEDTTAKEVFTALRKKFKGNVFRIQRPYPRSSAQKYITSQWEDLLGADHLIHMPDDDLAIGDITLGVYAVVSGARTVEQYLKDMANRQDDLGDGEEYEPQSPERIAAVAKALEPLRGFKPTVAKAPKKPAKAKKKPPKSETDDATEEWQL